MRLFAIGDLHLSGNPPKKPMEVFGPRWINHWQRIREDWLSRVHEDDVVLIAGDTSWAMHLKEAQEDLDEIRKLPGTKYIIRGNHDYWWESAGKLNRLDEGKGMHYLYGSTVTLDKAALPSAGLMDGSAPATSTIMKKRTPNPTAVNCSASNGACRKRQH
jgi:predicted phosphohydrolase